MASVFFSYSHKDEELRNELETHLALLKNQGLIDAWHDRRIVAGDELDESIFGQLETADIILLLVSADFIASTYCYSKEMMRAMERHAAGEARVIPVILRHCEWASAPFGKLLAAPRDGRPVTAWPDRDEAFADVAKQVRRAIETGHSSVAKPTKRPAAQGVAPITAAAPAPSPRSSNLRLKQVFTEKDAADFVRSSFEFVCRFFEGSINAVRERNPDVDGTFERIDSRRMAATLYRNGSRLSECSVRIDGFTGRGSNSIAFSYDASASQGTFNEMLTVEAGEQSLHFKPIGMAWTGGSPKNLSEEGAAEFLWELFIKRAQG
ncbi:hypothetical protein PIGHUM_03656 [Pigmentiphaga humi]|uniref:TIR domain-containing protein n=1 Tax=Pigmentiphaga humi TaxID=2478468 RepID=A0A3P4B6M0_9BURK|nr:toll/interleukin-1 receptor domain-containing protein [Pigmentiphaga humi]MBN9477695.1 toll/interleukin-1 receptor domain-containing protein [Burkholderiales bacterium]OJW94148.1 MAG: hypothetical protein BGO71_01570 [Burkholderiales bacterium 67-32]VCU71571.1 hypothetical protein PIGHUM_03656 [Pigmentiphaga humi]